MVAGGEPGACEKTFGRKTQLVIMLQCHSSKEIIVLPSRKNPSVPSTPSPRTRSRLAVCFVALALLLTAWPGQAQTTDLIFVAEPSVPVASRPFRLVISGTVLAFQASPRREDRSVVLEGNTIRIVQKGGLLGIPSIESYLASVDVGPLAEGTWNVEVEFEAEGTAPPLTFGPTKEELGSIQVGAPYRIDGPDVSYSSTAVSFTISRVDTCSSLGGIEVIPGSADDGADGTVTIPWNQGCPILPPPPELRTLETGLIGPLTAGTWNIDVVDGLGYLQARHQLEILPNPVLLQNGRFQVDLVWFNNLAADDAFPATPPTEDSALYAFFTPGNWEVMLKVLDGCAINGFYWVFTAANTNQGYDVLVTDTETGQEWTYHNPLGTTAPAVTDTSAFPCGI